MADSSPLIHFVLMEKRKRRRRKCSFIKTQEKKEKAFSPFQFVEICRETNRKSDGFYSLTQRDVGPVPGGTSGASRTIATHPDVDL